MLDSLLEPDDEEEDPRTEEERADDEREDYEDRRQAELDAWDNGGFDEWEAKHL